ncbi:MAG: H-type lectin domain-containing protein [Actinomycetota bacterium]
MRLRSALRLVAVLGLLGALLTTASPGSAAGTPTLQTGVVTFAQSNSATWYSVTFDEAFDDAPIVVMGPISYAGTHPAMMRVRNVTTTGFEYQLDEWEYLDGGHITDSATWVAAAPGEHDLRKMTGFATSIDLDHTWQSVSLGTGFDTAPVVFASVSSDNDAAATVIRMRNVGTTSVDLRLQEEEAGDDIHGAETVHVLAFSEGSTTEDGLALVVGRSGNEATNAWYTVTGARARGATGVLADMQTFDGPDTAGVRYQNLSDDGVDLKIEEETSGDSETSHTTEVLGWMLITSW